MMKKSTPLQRVLDFARLRHKEQPDVQERNLVRVRLLDVESSTQAVLTKAFRGDLRSDPISVAVG